MDRHIFFSAVRFWGTFTLWVLTVLCGFVVWMKSMGAM